MDLRKLKKLIDLVQESGISELEVTEGEEKVRIAKHSPVTAVSYAAAPPPLERSVGVAAEPAAKANDGLPDGYVVKSPMVGTFYRATSPGAAPLVRRPCAESCALLSGVWVRVAGSSL